MLKDNASGISIKLGKILHQVLVLRFPVLTITKSSKAFRKCNTKLGMSITATRIREVSHIF